MNVGKSGIPWDLKEAILIPPFRKLLEIMKSTKMLLSVCGFWLRGNFKILKNPGGKNNFQVSRQ